MKIVFKYLLELDPLQVVRMPETAQLLTVQMQGGKPRLWALVETNNAHVPVTIEMLATGERTDDNARIYISTIQLHDGAEIYHFFQRT